MPACPRGSFATEVERIFPQMQPPSSITLVPASDVMRAIEPGCVVPFRREPDERLLDVGRVVAKTMRRSDPSGKPAVLGRGRMQVGRRMLRLSLADDGGDQVFTLEIDGARVHLVERGAKPFEGEIDVAGDTPLPLPIDALVSALDRCDDDERLGRSEDGNVIEARRGAFPLWRSRYVDERATMVIDTAVACAEDDARMLWRTAVGDLLPMIAVASVRSDRVLVIVRQGPSTLDDGTSLGIP